MTALASLKFPAACLALTICFLVLEAWRLGFKNSALSRICSWSCSSTRRDVLYFALNITMLSRPLAVLLSCGLGYWLARAIERDFSFRFLQSAPLVLQFSAILLLDSFAGYWHHRLMHGGRLWLIHRIHHSATEMNGITTFRNHPIDGAVAAPFRVLPLALLGPEAGVLAAYGLLNIWYQIAVHSRWNWGDGFIGRWLVINPSRHWVHHSSSTRFYHTNFSTLTIWDRLFGTYQEPTPEAIASLGFPDHPSLNIGRAWSLFARAIFQPHK